MSIYRTIGHLVNFIHSKLGSNQWLSRHIKHLLRFPCIIQCIDIAWCHQLYFTNLVSCKVRVFMILPIPSRFLVLHLLKHVLRISRFIGDFVCIIVYILLP